MARSKKDVGVVHVIWLVLCSENVRRSFLARRLDNMNISTIYRFINLSRMLLDLDVDDILASSYQQKHMPSYHASLIWSAQTFLCLICRHCLRSALVLYCPWYCLKTPSACNQSMPIKFSWWKGHNIISVNGIELQNQHKLVRNDMLHSDCTVFEVDLVFTICRAPSYLVRELRSASILFVFPSTLHLYLSLAGGT